MLSNTRSLYDKASYWAKVLLCIFNEEDFSNLTQYKQIKMLLYEFYLNNNANELINRLRAISISLAQCVIQIFSFQFHQLQTQKRIKWSYDEYLQLCITIYNKGFDWNAISTILFGSDDCANKCKKAFSVLLKKLPFEEGADLTLTILDLSPTNIARSLSKLRYSTDELMQSIFYASFIDPCCIAFVTNLIYEHNMISENKITDIFVVEVAKKFRPTPLYVLQCLFQYKFLTLDIITRNFASLPTYFFYTQPKRALMLGRTLEKANQKKADNRQKLHRSTSFNIEQKRTVVSTQIVHRGHFFHHDDLDIEEEILNSLLAKKTNTSDDHDKYILKLFTSLIYIQEIGRAHV